LAKKYKDRITFLKINLQNIEEISLATSITALPTFLFFKNDGTNISWEKEAGLNIIQLEQYISAM